MGPLVPYRAPKNPLFFLYVYESLQIDCCEVQHVFSLTHLVCWRRKIAEDEQLRFKVMNMYDH